jgi:hypothetical protein
LSHDFALANKQSKAKQNKAKVVFCVLAWSLAGSLSSVLVAFFCVRLVVWNGICA